MPSPRARAILRGPDALALPPGLVQVVAAVTFASCAAGGMQLYDSGELAAAAIDLAGSHPPGQPLHALIGRAFAFLPLGPLTFRLSLLSGVCALSCVVIAARLCDELCAELEVASRLVRGGSQACAMLGILLAGPVLRQSLRIELYTLALLLFLTAALLLFRWARDGDRRSLFAAALVAGLAACLHPPHALAIALTGACFGVSSPRRLLRSAGTAVLAVSCGLFPLLTLVYLPVRAHAGAQMWGDPTDLAGFVRYVSGEAFLRNVAQHDRLQLFADYGLYFLQVTSGVPAIGALLLLSPAARHPRRALLGLLLAAVAALLAACLQPLEIRNPDNVAYVAPAVALFAVAGAAGFAALAQRGRPLLAALGLCSIALSPYGVAELRQQLRADAPALDTLAVTLFDTPPPRTLVVATTDFVATAWMLAQSAERARPDVGLFVQGLSTSSWHWAQLAEHPGLSGRPLRAPGGDAHDGYTRGAVLSALPQVSVALELDLPGRAASVAGPYALLQPVAADQAPRRLVASIGERLLPVLARDARAGSDGDAGAAAAVVRHVFATRARRLLRLGLPADALASARDALFRLPAAELALVRVSGAARNTGDPLVIDDRASYLTSLEDAVRLAAAELWALSAREPARELLARQFERGDKLALLQLAHLQAFDGDRAAALRTLEALRSSAPELRQEAEPLRNALARPARP